MDIDEQAHGTQVSLPAGGSIVVRLVEKPMSGFTWGVVRDGGPALVLVGDETRPGAGVQGGSASHRWLFEARTPGRGWIELVYRRGWDKSSPPTQTFAVEVRVE